MAGSVPFAAGFDELASNVASNFECFSDGSALGDEAGKFLGSCEVHTFRQQFDVNLKGEFHPESRVA